MCKNKFCCRLTEHRVGPPGGVDGEAPVVGAEVEVGRLQLLRPLRAAHEDGLVHAEPVDYGNPKPKCGGITLFILDPLILFRGNASSNGTISAPKLVLIAQMTTQTNIFVAFLEIIDINTPAFVTRT